MKAAARVLEITCFFAAFLSFAYSLAHTIDPGTCKRIVVGPMGWSLSIITLGLAIGFGALSRDRLSKAAKLALWLFSAVFFAAHAKFFHCHDFGTFGEKWLRLAAVFTPDLRPGDALEAIAAFHVYIVDFWMPFASVVSFMLFILTLLRSGKEINRRTQAALSGGG